MNPPRHRRFPLWAATIPLLAGVAVWALLWNGYRRDFEATLAQLLPESQQAVLTTGGFPYRLEVRATPLALDWSGDALMARITAAEAIANRVPWQAERTVLNLRDTSLRLALQPLKDAAVTVTAPVAQASLRTADGRIDRLSVVWQDAEIAIGWLPMPIRADVFEAHVRETPSDANPEPDNPRLPTQDQLVLSGTAVRFGDGDPLQMSLDSEVTAGNPVSSLAGWLQDGTVETRALLLSDGTGEVARFTGTIVPAGDGGLRLAGTVETVCPQSVRAAFAGMPAPSERRSRRPERIAFTGLLPGGLELAPSDPARPLPPVRAQQPPCPRLR